MKCKEEELQTPIRSAEKETALNPGGFATAEAAAHIMLRSSLRVLLSTGRLSRQTMSNWILKCTEMYLQPLIASCMKNFLAGMLYTQMKPHCRFLNNWDVQMQASAICSCTVHALMQKTPLYSMITKQAEARNILKSFWKGMKATSRQTVIPYTMTWEKKNNKRWLLRTPQKKV